MSNFVEKIEEKLHIGGHKKEGEHEHQHAAPPHAAGYAGEHEHQPHSAEHVGYAQSQAGYGVGHVEQYGAQPEHGYGGEHAPHSVEHGGYVQPQGYGGHQTEQYGSHPEYGYGGEHGHAPGGVLGEHATGHAPVYVGGAHGEHATGHYGQEHGHGGVGVPPASQHEGPLEKVKHKIKHDGGEGDSSSSSSSESDGEGGRRRVL